MDFDLDPLDDLLPDCAVKNARAGGKFQPKAKLRPRKPSSVSVPSSHPSTPTVAFTTQPSLNNQVSGLINDNNGFQVVSTSTEYGSLTENVGPIVGQNSNATVQNNSVHENSCLEETNEENADVYIGFDSFDDICPQSTNLEVNASSRSPTDAQVIAEAETEAKTLDDPLTRGEATISANCEELHVESRRFETQESDVFSCFDTQDIVAEPTTNSDQGHRRGKLQPVPKPHAHTVKRNCENASVENATDSMYWGDENAQWNPSQTEYMDGEVQGTSPEYPATLTDEIDFSATITGFYEESMPTDPTSHHQMNQGQEQTNTEEVHQQVAIPEVPEVGTIRSSKRQRKRRNEYKLVDESDDEVVPNDVDPTYDYSLNEDNNTDGEYRAENKEAPKKKARKKKDTADKEKKPVRKRKKANEESDKSKEAPRKKFPHSTRRNKRRIVDKTLLETPEDEIDFKKLKIRDLIIYADYKERAEKKEGKTLQTPTTNQSDATSSANRYNEEEGFGWEPQDRDYDEEGEGEEKPVEETLTYFNYQTYMEKTPVTKWSKQDTELFYEGIQQFGTDLSMIQQLFPDRTRRQIKLKYKKEERQQPLRLHEAIVNRSSDHSHFESVIERLKKIAAEDKLNSDMDGSDGLIGVEADEVALEFNGQEESAKTEKLEDREEVDHVEAADIPAVQSPVKSCDDDSEDDMFRWSQYNSEL